MGKYGCADLSIEDLQRNQSGSVTPIAGPSERPRVSHIKFKSATRLTCFQIDDNVRATTRNRRTTGTRRPPPSPPKNRKNRKVRHRDPQAVDDSRARIRVARKKDEIVAKTTMVNRVFVGNVSESYMSRLYQLTHRFTSCIRLSPPQIFMRCSLEFLKCPRSRYGALVGMLLLLPQIRKILPRFCMLLSISAFPDLFTASSKSMGPM